MKKTITGTVLGAIITMGTAQSATVFSADFSGSTATTSGTAITGLTSASNLDAGTSPGSWSGLATSTGGTTSGIDVTSAAATAMSGNWMLIGRSTNDTSHSTTATIDLSSEILLDGATISMDLNIRNSGGENGGLLVTGYTSGGTALFTFTGGNGGSPYGQRELATSSDISGTRDNTHNNLWSENGDGKTINLSLAAAGYTLTGDGGTTNLAGSYFASGDLASIKIEAKGSKALWGIDNISVAGTVVPEPSSTALLGLGGIALILRRRK
ncbi:PEP-CTERM sorting domain-containing protein [Verrucomicrobiaceae bacterium N1E253]|uniref:PEP-CTERM sorting domain-containing protein n=1 Tax=Oceaniferula marina TaxID=2748318 RepID=A0A851GSV4_9BACT|nr:PEP-CTERM sorting domain-containing protein [Oceaniferula marina]NWK57334.1 PEP-CTERM sorting domain-containing protein [Oceaniferula marina]